MLFKVGKPYPFPVPDVFFRANIDAKNGYLIFNSPDKSLIEDLSTDSLEIGIFRYQNAIFLLTNLKSKGWVYTPFKYDTKIPELSPYKDGFPLKIMLISNKKLVFLREEKMPKQLYDIKKLYFSQVKSMERFEENLKYIESKYTVQDIARVAYKFIVGKQPEKEKLEE